MWWPSRCTPRSRRSHSVRSAMPLLSNQNRTTRLLRPSLKRLCLPRSHLPFRCNADRWASPSSRKTFLSRSTCPIVSSRCAENSCFSLGLMAPFASFGRAFTSWFSALYISRSSSIKTSFSAIVVLLVFRRIQMAELTPKKRGTMRPKKSIYGTFRVPNDQMSSACNVRGRLFHDPR
jgi:hypothetical protein